MTSLPIALVVPGSLDQRTGGYIYDRRMADGLHRRGWTVEIVELDASFPCPTPAALHEATDAFARIRSGTIALIDGLALGAMPDLIERESRRLQIVALVHLPLAAAMDLEPGANGAMAESERRALHRAALIVVTGRASLPFLAPYGLAADRIAVVEPGTDRVPLARGSQHQAQGNAPLELLCAATINPAKGHQILLEALAALPHRGWRMTCAGSLTRSPQTVARVRASIARLSLGDCVSLAGDLNNVALDECFDRADVFVLATRQETYGMAVAEALARGLPVVSTRTGAIPELVGDEAGLVVPVDDQASLTSALARVIDDAPLRERLAQGSRRVRARLTTWEEAVTRMAMVLERLPHG